MGLLNDKVAIVTGAGGGIGRGIARRFAREGAAVVIAELDSVSGETVVREVNELGGRGLFVKTDIMQKASILAVIEQTVQHFGRVDILINNAFVPTPNVKMEDKTDEMLEQTLHLLLRLPGGQCRPVYPICAKLGEVKLLTCIPLIQK